MFNIARRGSSSAAKSLFSLSTFSRYSTPNRARDIQRCLSQISPSVTPAFRSGSVGGSRVDLSRRSAASSAVAEGEVIEGEIEQEVASQKPPSDKQIDPSVQHGPVTSFKDLAERGMVCQTVVDTITERMGLETMTQVQSLTISQSLEGQDM